MSLINQMLKDLEQRGAGSTDAEKIIKSSLNTTQNPSFASPHINHPYHAKHGVPYLKISGLMILLAGGAYLWMQSAPALSQSVGQLNALALTSKPQDKLESIDSAPENVSDIKAIAEQQFTASKPVSLFESSLKYPVTATGTLRDKLDALDNESMNKAHEKATVIANVMPNVISGEVLATHAENTSLQNKALESSKPSEVSEAAALQATPDKVAATTRASAHTNANNTGKQVSPEQKSANTYRQALSNLQQGRIAEAQNSLFQSLEANPSNQDARQTLAGLLLDNNRKDEARVVLAAGLALAPEQTNFRVALARLQVELGDKSGALSTLEQGLAYANSNADYQSFLATLLQRVNRHEEAIHHYNMALTINAGSVNSLVGLGISLQALGKLENAQDAYARAQTFASLSPELTQFIDQQLKQINQHLQTSSQK